MSAGLLQDLVDDGLRRGLYSGAAAGIRTAAGTRLVYAGTHAYGDATPVGRQSLFDLASVSKTVTAAVLVRLAEAGAIDLDAPVLGRLPIGSGRGAEAITARMLLLHTSGLPAESFIWRDQSIPVSERLARVLSTALENPPDAAHTYSCLGYIAAGALAQQVTGRLWSELVYEQVAQPLSLTSLRYGPVPAPSAVATEEEPWVGRGIVRGEVHDELNWFLGGKVGNAGLFATAADTLAFAAAIAGREFLTSEGRRWMTQSGIEERHAAPYGQALGPRVADAEFMGDLEGIGHPGFTGTMWIADPETGNAAILLTNRVHPHRDGVDLDPFRREFSSAIAPLLSE